jgi:4-hydroxyphenylpyruvate dioxygenase
VRLGIATVSLSGLLADKLDAIAKAGFDGVEIFDQDLVACPLSPREVAARCADLGLTVDLLQPVRDVEGVPPEDFARVLHRVRRKLDVAAELGAPTVLACSNVAPDARDDVDLSADQLRQVGDLAAERGVRVAFEALAWGRHTHRLVHAWERVARADHPAVGLAVDTFHMLARGDGPEALDGVPADKLFFLQVADAPHLDMHVLQWSRHHRCFPGQGTLDVLPLVAAVLDKGYTGPVSLEVFSDVVREAEAGETAMDAYRSLLFLQDQLARLQRRPTPTPPPPAAADTAFVELAVGADDGPAARLLTSLGFAPAGEHVSKPVTWWRNGDAHLVVNRGEGTAGEVRPVALAVVAEPVTDVAARAHALCWPEVTRRRSPEEARLPSLTSPAGVHVLVSAAAGRSDSWLRDFVPVDAPVPASTWRGIDHVGTAVDEWHLNAETSFHRGLFAFEPGPVSEFMEPHGRMRSRVLRPRAGDVRVVLSVADTRATAPRGINQVAFRCDDVRAEVRRLRALGADLVDVPENYYADLEARLALPSELLDDLREHGLLYDRDGEGELLHTYTPLVAGRFYVELLERRGGYDGFGSANTAVRLALQAPPART